MANIEPKRVLLVVTKSNFGGAQRYVFEIAAALAERGMQVAVASGGTSGALIDKLREHDIQHFSIAGFQRNINVFKEIMSVFSLGRIIWTYKPHVVHLNSSKAGGIGAVVSRLLLVPNIVFTVHGWQYHEPRSWLSRQLTFLLSWATGVLCHRVITVSEHDRATAPRLWVRRKCTTIHNGIPNIPWVTRDEARKKLRVDPAADIIQVCTVAELTRNKNLLFAIRAIAEHNQNQDVKLHYTIISDGEERQKITDYLYDNNITCVTLAGQVNDARRYLKAFDVFLLPSLKEGLPYALLEAAAAGLPLIASDVGGISEIITSPHNGLLIDPGIPQTLQQALLQITDAATRASLASGAYGHSSKFTLNKMVDQTVAVYESSTTSSASADSRATD